jgi:chromosome segregation ATPase
MFEFFQMFQDDFDSQVEQFKNEFFTANRLDVVVLLERMTDSNKSLWYENQQLKRDHKTVQNSMTAQEHMIHELNDQIKTMNNENLQLIAVRKNLTEKMSKVNTIASKLKQEMRNIRENADAANVCLNETKVLFEQLQNMHEQERELMQQYLDREKEKRDKKMK